MFNNELYIANQHEKYRFCIDMPVNIFRNMRIRIFIIAAFVMPVFLACEQKNTNKESVSITGEETTAEYEEVITSEIRPGLELLPGKIYTDSFQYIGYNDDSDYWFFIVEKDGKRMILIDDCPEGTVNFLNRGDLVEIEWKIDSTWVAGDGDALYMAEWATKIRNMEEGKVSLFKKMYTQPLKYHYKEEYGFTESFLDKIYKEVEYYLAYSKQEAIIAAINNPAAVLCYSIEELNKYEELHYVIDIFADPENNNDIVQRIYLDDELEKIYEYNFTDEKLTEFD